MPISSAEDSSVKERPDEVHDGGSLWGITDFVLVPLIQSL